MTIAFRLWAGSAIMLAALALLGGLMLWQFTQADEATAELARIDSFALQLQEVRAAATDAETGERGYLLTGQEAYLAPYQAATRVLEGRFQALSDAAGDNAPLKGRLDHLRDLVGQRLTELAGTIHLRRTEGPEAAAAAVLAGHGRLLMDEIRAGVDGLMADQDARLGSVHARLDRLHANLRLLFASGAPFFTLLVLWAAYRTVLGIRRPLGQLSDGIRRISEGDLSHAIAVTGAREFARLADAYNRMTALLSREQETRRHAERSLADTNVALVERGASLEARTRSIDQLSRMTNRMQGCRNIAELAEVAERFAPKILPGLRGKLYVLSNSKNVLSCTASWNDPAGSGSEFGPEECWGLRRGQPHVCDPGGGDLMCQHVATGRSDNYGCFPLVAQGETVGLVYLEGLPPPNERTASGVLVDFDVFAENIALALVNLRLRETLRNLSIRDPLTGLFNRRYLTETFELDLARAARSQTSLACIMLDVDHFKRFNDGFGHDAGDAVLKQLGLMLASLVRKGDLACRFGGEEFTLLLPGATADEAIMRAQQIREAVKALSVIHRGRTLGPITISFGVAAYPEHGATAEAVLHAADIALLRAKRDGRDRVVQAMTGEAAG